MLYATFFLILVLVTLKVYDVSTDDTESWTGKWFPENPLRGQVHSTESPKVNTQNKTEKWNGKWFPKKISKEHVGESKPNIAFGEQITATNSEESWKGKWFPGIPSVKTVTSIERNLDVSPECDNGKDNIGIDFDPDNKRDSHKYLCLDLKSKYDPKFNNRPVQREYVVPPTYEAPSYCLNETIEYADRLPTFGAYRYLRPKFGEYKFLPPQRWMHSLKDGAMVMLYHPCAYRMQVDKLRTTLNACLYRHVITPSTMLLPERPLALIAWGKSLEMSVVDVPTVVNFIKENIKKGAHSTKYHYEEYDAALLSEAKLVTDEYDSEVCANINV